MDATVVYSWNMLLLVRPNIEDAIDLLHLVNFNFIILLLKNVTPKGESHGYFEILIFSLVI
jgi:hypothetical protein